jgi:hypothetical protein
MNIIDDIDYLKSNPQFLDKMNKTYFIESPESVEKHFSANGCGTRSNKDKIKFMDSLSNLSETDLDICQLDESIEPKIDLATTEPTILESTIESIYQRERVVDISRNSTATSNNSITNYTTDGENEGDEGDEGNDNDNEDSEEEDDNDNEDSEEYSSEENSNSNSEDEDLIITIKNFPCQLICQEKCDGTLDELFDNGEMDIEKSSSCIFQIIMTLVMYQKLFEFTHNDLHTNNIMYIDTDITHLVYHYIDENSKLVKYKIPTFGKIFKIIDFGRSIYKVNGKTFCSDSFENGGDGYSQYNCEPFYNSKKPVLEPNMSFDLCRLACSIYDFIIDDEEPEEMDLFQRLIYNWCLDDSGKNILYKKSGEERYPNFKLYKMIARTVHSCVPLEQLDYPLFKNYIYNDSVKGKKVVDKKGGKGKNKVVENVFTMKI